MDDDILKTVHSIFGKSVEIVDCEKTSSVRQEEVLLINGIPVTLAGHDGDAIKSALLTGQVPSVELLNQLLYQAGILRQPVQLETSLSVKSSMVTTEEVSVTRDGQILDGHTSETKEDHVYNSSKKEIWEPAIAKPDIEKIPYHAVTLQSAEATADEVIPNCSNMRGLTFTITDQIMSGDCRVSPDNYYNYKGNERVANEEEEEDDDDGDDDDEYGQLYVLNAQLTPSSPFVNRLPPIRNATTIINSDGADDISGKYVKVNSKSLVSAKNSSAFSFDSGHDGVFNSPSQQTAPIPIQQLIKNNTMHSSSSCYDFISADEADFLTSSNPATMKEHSFADLKNREPSQISKSSNNKNVKSPNLGKKPSMSSSSCVSAANPSSSSAHQHASDIAAAVPSSTTTKTTTSAISITSVENGLVFRDGNLISGLLDSLITHMVPSSQYYPDRSFTFSFLLSARLFIRPHELLARISEIWENQQQLQHHKIVPPIDVVDDSSAQAANLNYHGRSQQMYPPQFADEQSRQKAIKSAQNCIRLLAEWIDTFPYDFRDERLMQHVRVLARKCVYIDNNLGKTVSNILQSLVQRLTVLEKYEEFLQTLAAQENNESCTTTEDLATHFKMFSSEASPECHMNMNAAGSTSSNEREEATLAAEPSVGVAGTVGIPHKSLSSSYTTAPGLFHQYQSIYLHSHQNSHHQSDSSSNSVNTLGPGGSGGGIGIGSCTSSGGVSNGVEISGICDLCPNAALLAHQLTHIELERLSHIGPEEFVQAFAKENHLESLSDMKKTRNLESYVQWFNRLSYLTATEIVKYPKKKQRVRVIEFWIETARECFNIGNFNSLMAIIAGLNLSPISRLKKTWSKVQLAKFSVLEHQMDPTSNFNSYRSTLKAAMWRSEGATNERERIIIPFFSLLVKDLYFLNEGCSNRLPNGHINFEKFWQLAKQVMEFNTWKKVTCPFEKLPKVIMFLQMSPVLNENTLSVASFECEPPENNQERGRYKTLKSETRQQT